MVVSHMGLEVLFQADLFPEGSVQIYMYQPKHLLASHVNKCTYSVCIFYPNSSLKQPLGSCYVCESSNPTSLGWHLVSFQGSSARARYLWRREGMGGIPQKLTFLCEAPNCLCLRLFRFWQIIQECFNWLVCMPCARVNIGCLFSPLFLVSTAGITIPCSA